MKWKLVAILLLIAVLPTIALGSLTYIMASNILKVQINESVEETIARANDSFDGFFEKVGTSLEYMASSRHVKGAYSNKEDEMEMMKEFVEYVGRYPDVQYVYLGMEDGRMLAYPDIELAEGYDPRQRPWYQSAMEKQGNLFWTEPYVDAFTNEFVISAVMEIKAPDGKPAGVLGVDINLQKLTEFIGNIKLGNNGYTFTVDAAGVTITHPDKEQIGKSIAEYDWSRQMLQEALGSFDYSMDGVDKQLVYQTNKTTGWKIAGVIEKKELTRELSKIKNTIYIICMAGIILAIIGSLFFSTRITNQIKSILHAIDKIGSGDMSIVLKSKSRDEIGMIAGSINKMIENMRSLIGGIQSTVIKSKGTAGKVTESSKIIGVASEEIASAVQEIAVGSSSQAREVEETLRITNGLADSIVEMMSKLKKIRQSTEIMKEKNEYGIISVEELKERFKKNNEAAGNVGRGVQEVLEKSSSISKIIESINAIASQTNMLALNAAIEAARAGDAGKGFAVVADEVRMLAEQSSAAADEIMRIVEGILKVIENTNRDMRYASQVVSEANSSIEKTSESFNEIKISAKEVSEQMERFEKDIEGIGTAKDSVLQSITSISAITEEASASTQEVSASAEEQTSTIEEVVNTIEELERIIEELSRSANLFKL